MILDRPPHMLIDRVFNKSRESLLKDDNKIKELISIQSRRKNPQEVKHKFDRLLGKMARIESDIILYNIGKKSTIAKFAAKWIFGINEKRIHALIKNVYGRLLGKQAANKQLYERLLYVLSNTLEGSQISSVLPCSYGFSPKKVDAIKSQAIRKKLAFPSKSIPIWKRVYHFFRTTLRFAGLIRIPELKLSDRQIKVMDELIAPRRISSSLSKEEKGDYTLVKSENDHRFKKESMRSLRSKPSQGMKRTITTIPLKKCDPLQAGS